MYAPGPFRADQLRSGDPYELSDGHAIRVAPSGSRHGAASVAASLILQSDPAVEYAGMDVGYSPEPGMLRAPDVSVLPAAPAQGWSKAVPPLAIEYADNDQDEEKLTEKIEDLLSRGTKYLWVVRLTGLRRVEVHTPGQPWVTVWSGDVLTAPGVLAHDVPVDALFDSNRAMDVTLRNLLAREGYASLAAIRDEGKAEGELGALRGVLEALFAARGQVPTDEEARRLREASAAELQAWIVRGV
jgi:Uma2 family endonuclease